MVGRTKQSGGTQFPVRRNAECSSIGIRSGYGGSVFSRNVAPGSLSALLYSYTHEARVPGYERDWGEKFDENLAYVLKK